MLALLVPGVRMGGGASVVPPPRPLPGGGGGGGIHDLLTPEAILNQREQRVKDALVQEAENIRRKKAVDIAVTLILLRDDKDKHG